MRRGGGELVESAHNDLIEADRTGNAVRGRGGGNDLAVISDCKQSRNALRSKGTS